MAVAPTCPSCSYLFQCLFNLQSTFLSKVHNHTQIVVNNSSHEFHMAQIITRIRIFTPLCEFVISFGINMDGFKIIYMPSDCLLLPLFHSVSDKNTVWINFEYNWLYVLSELFLVHNWINKHSIQCFEHPHIQNILIPFVSDVLFVHSWTFKKVYHLAVLLSSW